MAVKARCGRDDRFHVSTSLVLSGYLSRPVSSGAALARSEGQELPMHTPCPTCSAPMVEHCPGYPRCRWRQCPERQCRSIVDGKGRVLERTG